MTQMAQGVSFLIFDMDEVLYDYDHGHRLKALARLTGRTEEEIDKDVWGGEHEALAEAGDPPTAEAYLAQYARLLRYPINEETWADIRKRMNTARPVVLDMVRSLKGKVDLALLTNNGMMLKKALPVCAPEMIEIFGEKAHVSAEFGTRKPDPEIYCAICERYGHAPQKSAFIDDKLENVQGAEAAGLIGHHYQSEEGLRSFLRELSLLP